MPGCRGKWIDWWFSTGLRDTEAYKKWYPETHVFYQWDKKWKPGRYIGASYYGEVLTEGEIHKFNFIYDDPAKYFNTSDPGTAWPIIAAI